MLQGDLCCFADKSPVSAGLDRRDREGIDVSLILRRNPDFSMTLLEVALDGSVTQ